MGKYFNLSAVGLAAVNPMTTGVALTFNLDHPVGAGQ